MTKCDVTVRRARSRVRARPPTIPPPPPNVPTDAAPWPQTGQRTRKTSAIAPMRRPAAVFRQEGRLFGLVQIFMNFFMILSCTFPFNHRKVINFTAKISIKSPQSYQFNFFKDNIKFTNCSSVATTLPSKPTLPSQDYLVRRTRTYVITLVIMTCFPAAKPSRCSLH